MTTTVTIELPDVLVKGIRQSARTRQQASPGFYSDVPTSLINLVNDALPDPDEDLVFEMLSAYCEAASLRGPTRDALNARMAEGMKAVLELLRERDAS